MNLSYVFEKGDPILVSVFCLLIGMSLVSWYVIIWKIWKLSQQRRMVAVFWRTHQNPNWPKLIHSSAHPKGAMAIILKEAVRQLPSLLPGNLERNEKLLSTHLAQSLDRVRIWLDSGLTLLASIGSSAPFIGLFGTVWGIYGALTHIAAEGNASLNVVAGPMGEALVATAAGLFAAIPAVLAYNAFVRQNRLLVQDLRHIAEQITFSLADFSKKPSTEPVKLVQGER